MSRYRLTLCDADGVVLDEWEVSNNRDDDVHDLTKPLARAAVMDEIVGEIQKAEGS